MAAKNPSSVIYWNDLENDEHLKTCSLAAKGLWDHHMLPIAARSSEPGVILLGNHPSRLADDLPGLLARATGETIDLIAALLRELIDSGAASVDDRGRVYNRRMVREEEKRQRKVAAGRKGGKARRKEAKPKQTPKQNPKQTPQQNDSSDGSNSGSKAGSTVNPATTGKQTANPATPEAQPKQDAEQTESKAEASSYFSYEDTDLTTSSAAANGVPEARPEAASADEDDLVIPHFLRRVPDGPQAAMAERGVVDEAFALWMPVAYELRIPEVGFLNPERRRLLAERLAECAKADPAGDWRPGWRAAMENLRSADWLRDERDPARPKRWVNLATLLKPENFTGLLEGRYAERHRSDRPDERSTTAALAGLAEAGSR